MTEQKKKYKNTKNFTLEEFTKFFDEMMAKTKMAMLEYQTTIDRQQEEITQLVLYNKGLRELLQTKFARQESRLKYLEDKFGVKNE